MKNVAPILAANFLAVCYCAIDANTVYATDWVSIPVPASAGVSSTWLLDSKLSDQFNYDSSTAAGADEFASRWRDSKPDGWLGPGATYFSQENYFVENGSLTIFGSRVPSHLQRPNFLEPAFTRNTYTSYITSKTTLRPGTYTEVRMKGGGTPLSSNFWLLDDNNETEIDVVEIYGDTDWFRKRPATNVHFFKRNGAGGGNFNNQDHHPRGGTNFAQTWHRYGVHWISETNVDFYYDGQLVRNLDLPSEIVDPSGQYLNEPLRLILDLEAHSWRGEDGIPSDPELTDWSINNMQVDWVRTYQATPLQEADFDGNLRVDGTDLLLWQQTAGLVGGAPYEAGDANGDGNVDGTDLAVWQQHYGSQLANSATELGELATTPEPSTLWLTVCILCGSGTRRYRYVSHD